jgi:hypothetical protein
VLSFGSFDSTPGNEIVALGENSIAKLQPETYKVLAKTEYKQQDCDSCVHMYPYLVPDGKGSILVSTSDGVSDMHGRLLWRWKADSFSRVVPIRFSDPQPSFFAYRHTEQVVLHNAAGKALWSNKLQVSDVGRYVTREGEELPFAVLGYGKTSELKIFKQDGKEQKTVKLPEWAANVDAIAWPGRGNFLVGAGSWLGVIDPDGKEVLSHRISDTSFAPYHGPDGTAVKFSPAEGPYLAVLSHGSSGYARSVLLIFDPKGQLVWQEELKKLSTIIAVPRKDGASELLLVGGMDGILEYRLSERKPLK